MNCPICSEEMMFETRLNMITYKTIEVSYCNNGHFCKVGIKFKNPVARWTGEIVEREIYEDEDEDEDEIEPHYQSEYERDNPRDNVIER